MVKTIRQRVYDYLDKYPDVSPSIIAKKLRVKYNSVRSAKGTWKILRGYIVGTKQNPVKVLIKFGSKRGRSLMM